MLGARQLPIPQIDIEDYKKMAGTMFFIALLTAPFVVLFGEKGGSRK